MKTFHLLLLFFLVTLASKPESINGVEHVIGAISDCNTRAGKEERVAMDMAIQDFNMQHDQTLLILRLNCSEHKPLQSALAARHLINNMKAEVILGPRSWEETSIVAEVIEDIDVPILSFADSSPPWAAERWPFLVQAVAGTHIQMKTVANIIQSSGWRRVNVIYEDTEYSAENGISPYLYSALQAVDVEISNLLPLPSFADSSLLHKELENLKKEQCRVFIVHTSSEIATRIFGVAKEKKMMVKEYVWITTDSITSLVHSMNFSLISSMQGVVGVRSSFLETGSGFNNFSTKFDKIFGRKYPEEKHHEPGIFALQAYDAVRTVGLAMNKDTSSSGRQLLETILKSDFDGLSGNIQFTRQKLEPTTQFQIINIIGKHYRELGFWTENLGFSHTIDHGVYNLSMESLGDVNWPGLGGRSSAPRGWDLPTIKNPLRIGVVNGSNSKYVKIDYDSSTNKYNFSGFSVQVFIETARHLKYSLEYEFIAFKGDYDDLVKKVQSKEFDAAVGDIVMTSARCEYVEFTHAHTETGLLMVVPTLRHSSRAWLFVKPFTKAMWLLTFFINVFNGFVVWGIERNYCSELRGPVLNQIGTLLWLAFATLFSLHGEKLHSNMSRMATVVWLFVALIITQSYTASLTSMLTVQNLEPKIANIETLKSNNAWIGCLHGRSFVMGYLEGPLGFKYSNIRNFSSIDEFARALGSGVIAAAFLTAPVAKLLVAKYCKSVTIAGPRYQVGGYGFAFPKGSLLLPDIDEAILKIRENGVLKDLEQRLIASEQCVDIQSDNETASLSPQSFFVLFIITGVTSSTSLLIYYFRAKDRYQNFIDQYKRIQITIMMALNKLGCHMARLSRKVSDAADENPENSPNNSNSRPQV